MRAVWALLYPMPFEAPNGKAIAVVAYAEGATYLGSRGETISGLDRARTQRVADLLGLAPDTPEGWLEVAGCNLGQGGWGALQHAPTVGQACARALSAVQEWRAPAFPDRAALLAHQARVLDEWSGRYPEVADGEVHDPEAELDLAHEMAGWVDARQQHDWLPIAVGEKECEFCGGLQDAGLHTGGDGPFASVSRPFARALLAKLPLLRAGLSDRQQARVRESLSDDIKKFCDVAVPDLRRPLVSQGATEQAEKLGVDLCAQAWHDQPRFDPGRGVFHLEHVVPVRAVRERCLDLTEEAEVMAILSLVSVAWILKTEDRELTRLGHRTRRDDPAEAYQRAGIALTTCHEG